MIDLDSYFYFWFGDRQKKNSFIKITISVGQVEHHMDNKHFMNITRCFFCCFFSFRKFTLTSFVHDVKVREIANSLRLRKYQGSPAWTQRAWAPTWSDLFSDSF